MSSAELFAESWEEIATRVLRRGHPGMPPSPELADIQDAVKARVHTLNGLARTKPPVPMRNRRDWEGKWDADAQWNRLTGAFQRWGVTPVIKHGSSEFARHDAVHLTRTNSLILYRDDLQRELTALADALREWPMTLADYSVLSLATELFHLLVLKAGKPPKDPWVDALAESLFVRDLLGLPFSPQVLELLRHHRTAE